MAEASTGYTQQDPTASGSELNQIYFIVRQMMARMDTVKLVQVKAVHAADGDGDVKAAGTVDVLPLVNQIDAAMNPVKHGIVNGIPWSRAQGGKNAVICDPEVGDIGYVVVSDRDTSLVRKNKAQANPGSFRRFNVADGVYVGGALNVAPEQYLVFTATGVRLVDKNGNSITLSEDGTTLTDKTGNVISTTSAGINLNPKSGLPVTVNGNLIVKNNLQIGGAIQSDTGGTYAGALQTSGDIIAGFGTGGQVGLQTHTHTQPNDSHGDTEQPTAAPTAGT